MASLRRSMRLSSIPSSFQSIRAPVTLLSIRTFSSSCNSLNSNSNSNSNSTSNSTSNPLTVPISSLRNISISAHVDSGKTTLTERLLHLTNSLSPPTPQDSSTSSSSSSSRPGDVDSGSTVTDFLEAERRRGITIQSAAVGPIWWPAPNQTIEKGKERIGITLVDTPGHIDFSIEVERALRVVDGNVVLLDAVEGVEAQTETVWNTAKRYGVKSTLLFINKLDRQGASISRCLNSIISKGLHPLPLLLQLPLTGLGSSYLKKGSKCNSTTSASSSASQLTEEQKILSLDSGLTGLIDLLDLQILEFSGLGGEIITKTPVLINPSSSLSVLQKEVLNARNSLIETLANQDDQLLEILLEKESTESYVEISGEVLRKVIRRLNLNGQVLPVFLGSAFRNVGIGPLLDGVREFLPSPVEKDGGIVEGKVEIGETGMVVGKGKPKKGVDETEVTSTSNAIQIHISDPSLTLLAFKVIYDKRKGPLTFIRVYSGTLKQSTISLVNTFNGKRERFNKIFLPYADSYVEVEELRAGQIGVLVGLKETSTGDTLISTSNPSSNSKSSITSRSTLKLREIDIPPPVFSMSIEPKSKSDEGPVSEALKMLVRTDPSLRIDDGSGSGNGGSGLGSAGTGQMVLSGMGELHLEISKDRLKDEFGVNARMGEVRVSYRETLGEEVGLEGVLGMGLGEKEIKKLLDQKVEEMESQAYERKEMLDKEVGGKKLKAGVKIQVRGLIHDEEQIREKIKSEQNEDDSKEIIKIGGNLVEMDLRDLDLGSGSISDSEGQDEFTSNSSSSYNLSSIKASFLSGITGSLSRGPLTSSPITGLYIKLSQPSLFGQEISPLKSLSMVSNSALRQLLKTSNPKMMEPVMNLTLKINGKDLGKVVGDLTGNQGGEIEDVRHGDEEISKDEQIDQLIYLPPEIPFSTSSNKEIGEQESKNGNTRVKAVVPLSNLVGYSTRLRAITAGTGEFEMEFKGFKRVDEERKKEILKELGRA